MKPDPRPARCGICAAILQTTHPRKDGRMEGFCGTGHGMVPAVYGDRDEIRKNARLQAAVEEAEAKAAVPE